MSDKPNILSAVRHAADERDRAKKIRDNRVEDSPGWREFNERYWCWKNAITEFAEGIKELKDDIARQATNRLTGIDRVKKLESCGALPTNEQLDEALKEK